MDSIVPIAEYLITNYGTLGAVVVMLVFGISFNNWANALKDTTTIVVDEMRATRASIETSLESLRQQLLETNKRLSDTDRRLTDAMIKSEERYHIMEAQIVALKTIIERVRN